MSNPKVLGPDGVLRDAVVFSTSLPSRFLTGTLPSDTFDAQVSIDGNAFSSDTALIEWGDGTWVVPNPSAEPDGLDLFPGSNNIRVRAILPTGSTTPSADATIRLVSDADIGVVAAVPTNVSLSQGDLSVTTSAESSSATGFRGMNFYASAYAGGGTTGYTRINVNLIAEGVAELETSVFGTMDVNALVKVDAEGDPVSDPLYMRLTGSQEDADEKVLQADFSKAFEVPETTRTIQIETTLKSVRNVTKYSFKHYRSAGPTSTPQTVQVGEFSSLPTESPVYYVVTGVYYDAAQNLEYESSFSEEVLGRPVLVTTTLGSFPSVSRQSITQQFISSIFRSNPQVKVEAGSILRDTVIDPFSSESERIRFVLDFFQRARTPTLLLQIDDPKSTGSSVAVSSSPYKRGLQQALYLGSANDVQGVIDSAFEAYASNFGKRRRTGVASQGEVLFYTKTRPSQSILIPIGTTVSGGGGSFTTTRSASISLEGLASYFDPVSGRYQVVVPVRASATGPAGNLGAGQVRALVSSLPGSMSVVNTSAMAGGKSRESNLELTVRVRNALASVDSGTAWGYLQSAADVAGVVQANVVAAGNPLMQRDLNAAGEHKGGKVDIWVQGENIATVTDVFAFTFEIAQDIQFEIIGNPSDYSLRALDSNLSEENPIVEMLDDPDIGYELVNASTGEVFDLTEVSITSYNTIQLSTTVAQPELSLTDVVLGSYRRRKGNTFVFPRQPVQAVSSVVAAVAGTLPASAVEIVRPNAPLELGLSNLAGDYLSVTAYTDPSGATVPSGDTITVTGESHVLVGSYPEFLDFLGANFLSVEVLDATGTVAYKGPDDPSGTSDYTVDLGTQTTALSITRVDGGAIPSGATVLINYKHDENFTVTYTTNLIVGLTQNAIDERKHVTADVLAKEAVNIPLDVEATVLLKTGRSRSTVDTSIRTNLENFFRNLRLGDPVRQSDVIDVLEQTEGVSYVVVPLGGMHPAQGSEIVREAVSTDTVSESTLLTSYTTNLAVVYLLDNPLAFATTDGGGPSGSFRGVFEDDKKMDLLSSRRDPSVLGVAVGRVYILGGEGRSIPGFSDDATLAAQGYVTETAITAQRKAITANRVLVSLAIGDSPTTHSYAITYVVGEDSGAKNVDPAAASFISAGSLVFTLDEAR
jgi:hypothetical protein